MQIHPGLSWRFAYFERCCVHSRCLWGRGGKESQDEGERVMRRVKGNVCGCVGGGGGGGGEGEGDCKGFLLPTTGTINCQHY